MYLTYLDSYDDDDDDDDDDAGLASPVAATGRRTSLQCPSSTSAASTRAKPPPPIRRTSSVTGTRPIIQSPTSDIVGSDNRRWGEAVPPGDLASPSRLRAIFDGRPTSPRRTPPLPRVSPSPRRSLSSAYADLCQTLNNQLAAGGGVTRRPTGQRLSSVDTSSTTAAVPIARRQSSAEVASTRTADTSLLMDIKRGVCLRPTISNDRSAPSIPWTDA